MEVVTTRTIRRVDIIRGLVVINRIVIIQVITSREATHNKGIIITVGVIRITGNKGGTIKTEDLQDLGRMGIRRRKPIAGTIIGGKNIVKLG